MAMLKTLTINGVTYNVTHVVPTSTVTLPANAWVADELDGEIAYSQVVVLPGVTAHTMVDLQPSPEQLVLFHKKVLGFVTENENGVVKVYAIGDKPANDHVIQTTLTEVERTGKIRSNTVGTTMPRPDWEQADPTKADYIKNKPSFIKTINGVAPDENGNVDVVGGTGTGNTNNAVMSVKNDTGWIYKTVASGASCPIQLTWSSLEDEISTGPGLLTISVNGTQKYLGTVEQGSVTMDVGEYLSAGSNSIRCSVSDIYGNSRTVALSVTCVALSLASSFDSSVPYSGAFDYPYTPTGMADKTVHFLVDGEEIGTATVTTSGRQQTFTIPAQSHGMHTLEVYFDATVDEELVESNSLYYALICTEAGNTTPIIATDFRQTSAEQYDTLNISYIVYDPASLTAAVSLSDGSKVTELTVDRAKQVWSYRPENEGALVLSITCGTTTIPLELNVTPSQVKVEAETSGLSLYLTAYGRSNNEANPGEWKYGNVAAELTGFNFKSDGWQLDESGATVLRVSGDARVSIPVKLFEHDFRTSGKTIEIKLTTRDVLNYDAPIITCWSGGRGLQITAQKALLKSEQSEISTQYKENDEVHLAFVVTKKNEHRLLMIYIDGVLSGVVQYPEDDDFSQTDPAVISIGSNDCTTDLHCIRVYDNDLTRYQIVDNWNAEMQIAANRADTWKHNDVFDDYGQIVISKLPKDLPYLVLQGAALPTYKGNKLPIEGYYVDPVNAAKSFTFTGAEIDVQGTSSAGYERKNYKIKFKGGFTVSGQTVENYILGKNNPATNVYTFKADVASSEGANNVELVKLYNDISPYRTAPQEENSLVRQGIDGYPIVIFHDDGNGPVFIGKYNFNHDKASDVFGFDSGDECWEIRNNTSNRTLFKSADFSGTDWLNDFEGRYPDGNTDPTKLAALAAWIASTDRTAVSTEAEKSARLEKFKTELPNWVSVESSLFYYLFTELFLLADSRAKNAFPTEYDNKPWCWLPYDMDTAIGINNEGKLAFGYELEDTDLVNGAQVYTGQQSVFWNNIRDAFHDELMEMYQELRSSGGLNYEDVERRFEEHQKVWPEAIFNEDAYYKYLAPLFDKNNGSYLGMLQGSKEAQRKWWLYNRFRYIDSKYNAGDALTDFITLRGYAKGNVTVKPYADIYATVKYGSYLVQERALRGGTYTLECPVDDLDDTEIYIYSASQIADLGDLKDLKVGYAEFAAGTKLTSLKLGDGGDYSNPNLTQLYAGNNVLLRTLDVRNCPNLGNTAVDVNATPAVDLSGCTNIENVYFDNTSITGLSLPNGGILKKLHLPETITNLTIRNQPGITEFVLPDYSNITTLRLENVSSAIDPIAILSAIPANSRVRLIGISHNADTYAEFAETMNKLDTMRGLDENGNNVDKAQVSGTVHITALTSGELKSIKDRYPSITVTYDSLVIFTHFYNEDGSVWLYDAPVVSGGTAVYGGEPLTKEDTAQYDYEFAGWSLTPGGSADANALTNVTEDRTVYAAFTATVRTYTVRFWNETTLLESHTVPYGGSAVYGGDEPVNPDGTSLPFIGFVPSPTNVTADMDCYAQYQEPFNLEAASWAEISAISEEGNAANYMSVGDTKSIHLNGTMETLTLDGTYFVYILGLNHNSEVEGRGIQFGGFKSESGAGGKDVCLTDIRYNSAATNGSKRFNYNHWGDNNYGGWAASDMRYDILGSTDVPPSVYGVSKTTNAVGYDATSTCATNPVSNTIMSCLPADLRAVMKPITKWTDNVGNTLDTEDKVTASVDYLPLLSEFEIFGIRKYANSYEQNHQQQYAYFASGNSMVKYQHSATNSAAIWWSRSPVGNKENLCCCVNGNGADNNNFARYAFGVSPVFMV